MPAPAPIAAATAQAEQMDFLLLFFRPLLTVDEAAYLLADASSDLVASRLDDGTLRGLDIALASPEERAEAEAAGQRTRRELRLYRYSVECLLLPERLRRPELLRPEMILPHQRDFLRRDEVARVLSCTPKHVAHLTEAGALHGARLSSAASQASADRTPRVSRASFLAFLAAREINP